MASEYEFEGKTKEEALLKASETLGLPEDQMQVEVISYGSTGIFGLVGVKKAKIKITVPEAPEKKIEETASTPVNPDDVGVIAQSTLEKIISFIVDDATVSVETGPESVRLKVEGGNSALLIGKHGRTLDALQYIVQKAVHKQKRVKMRITVDVEGYRKRREASLVQLALRLGEKVKRSGKPATISPMNAYDRRIVHVALKDDSKIRTQSMGSGTLRKLVIYPQRQQKGSQAS